MRQSVCLPAHLTRLTCSKRLALKKDPLVRKAINKVLLAGFSLHASWLIGCGAAQIWMLLKKNETGCLDKDEYSNLFIRLCKILNPVRWLLARFVCCLRALALLTLCVVRRGTGLRLWHCCANRVGERPITCSLEPWALWPSLSACACALQEDFLRDSRNSDHLTYGSRARSCNDPGV